MYRIKSFSLNKFLVTFKLFFFISIFQACGQSNEFKYEQDIKSAFDMNDSLMYFSYEYAAEGKGSAFKLSEIKKVNLKKLDSVYFPKIIPVDNGDEIDMPGVESIYDEVKPNNNSFLRTWNTHNLTYNLEIGNIRFKVVIDFEKCILYDIYNYYGDPRDGQIVGFSYSKESEQPLSYRAYHFQRIRTGWESVGSETLEEKRYYFTNTYNVSEKDKNGSPSEKKELYELGVKIHRIVKQLLLTYKASCPSENLKVTFDSIKLKYRLDSIFNLLSLPEFDKNNENIKLKSLEPKLIMQVTLSTTDLGKLEKMYFFLYGTSKSRYEQVYLPPRIGEMVNRTLRQNISFNTPKFMCMPCAAEKKMTILFENNKVAKFYY